MPKINLLLICLLIFIGCSPEAKEKGLESPNFILIMADDLGYEGIGTFGNKAIKTPVLDQLAAQGLVFTDFHSNGSVCSPTRAALLTGRYQQRSALEGVVYAKGPTRQTGLALSEITLAEVLKEAGYATGIMGKWHLGYDKAFNPSLQGFDEFYGYVSGNVDFHSHYDNSGVYDWYHNQDTITEVGYVTDLITQHASEFIENHQEEPFFLYVPHQAPHVPFQGRKDTAYRFSDREFSYFGPVEDRKRAYREMIEVMDEGIGKIWQQVKALGLEEKTMILFISDNGAESFGHNGSLRGNKGSLFEGGHRVPAIAYWKGKIPAGKSDQLTISMDWMPTILSMAGIDKSKYPQQDGADLSSHLFSGEKLKERKLFWRYRDQLAVRRNEWKLMVDKGDTLLFNLEKDQEESTDVHALYPEISKELSMALKNWVSDVADAVEQKTI